MIQTDMDRWTSALAKCRLDKAILPTSRGYLIENVDCYNKIQAILNAPAMEHCHKFLYNLDVEDLQEDEIEKIDCLYKLGQDRGFISQDDADDDADDLANACTSTDLTSNEPPTPPVVEQPPVATVPLAAYTVMYSAMKDGQIKTGEAYSNSISPRAAKADVLAKLSQIGYDNVSILAIEATDPDGISAQPFQTQPAIGQVGTAITDAEQTDEAKDEDVDAEDKDDEDADVKDTIEKPDDSTENADSAKELSANEKQQLKDKYKLAFKEAMLACQFDDMKFDDLTLEQKIQLLTKLDDEKWNGKPDPTKFMEKDDLDKLYSTVMKG